MRYIIFSRVSTGLQTTENQILECRRYVEQHRKKGDTVIEFNEEATSTRLPMADRPILQAMLKEVKRGDTLVFYKISRWARKGGEIVSIYDYLVSKKVNIVSLYEKQIDDMFIHAYAMVAQCERKNIAEATKSGLARKQHNGEMVGKPRFGYRLDESKIQKRDKSRAWGKPYLLIPDEEEWKTVEEMKRLRSTGMSYEQITQQLAATGYHNRKGNPIQKMTVFRVLKRLGMQNPSHAKIACQKSHGAI